MGMGEPFLNYDAVIDAVTIMNKKMGIAARRIAISTVGIVDGIKRLSREPLQVNLAISIHAPNDALRARIIPANKLNTIYDIIGAVYE